MAKLKRTYTESEVSKILKESEGHRLEGEPDHLGGHAEGLHGLGQVGRKRHAATDESLSERLISERKAVTGAFDRCQVKAITYALNSHGGQTTLGLLEPSYVAHVFCYINVSSMKFRMKTVTAIVPKIEVEVKGKMKMIPVSGPMNKPVMTERMVVYVAMKLMKDKTGLHIRTAYPTDSARGDIATCEVFYSKDLKIPSMNQVLPV